MIAVITNNTASSLAQTLAAAPPAPAPAAAVQVLATTAWPIAAAVPANKSGVLNATNADGTDTDANLSVDSDIVSKPSPVPFAVPHLLWRCTVDNCDPGALEPRTNVTALVDDGAHLVLICPQLVDHLHLKCHLLPEPIEIGIAISDSPSPACKLTEWVKLKPHDISAAWSSCTVHTIIAPGLCSDIILGLPFLKTNQIVIDHHACTVVAKQANFDLLHPTIPVPHSTPVPFATIRSQNARVNHADSHALPFYHLSKDETSFTVLIDPEYEHLCNSDVIAALRTNIEHLAFLDHLKSLHDEIKEEYKDVFQPLPHMETLLTHTTCKIKLKNADKVITSCSYSCPHKFQEAWQTLIEKNVDAGRIRPSSSSYLSSSFLIPKTDKTFLPRWVNDFRALNANMVSDKYPLPCIDDILADAGHGKIWSKLDMMDSFFTPEWMKLVYRTQW